VIQKRESKAQCLLGSGFEVTHYHFHHHLSIRSKLLNPIHIPREENQKAQCSENQMHFTETKKQHKLTQNLAFRGAAAIRFTSKAFSGDWPGPGPVRRIWPFPYTFPSEKQRPQQSLAPRTRAATSPEDPRALKSAGFQSAYRGPSAQARRGRGGWASASVLQEGLAGENGARSSASRPSGEAEFRQGQGSSGL